MASPTSTPLRMGSYATAKEHRCLNEWTINAVLAATLGLTLEVKEECTEEAAATALAESQLAIEAAEAVTVQPSSAAAGSELQAELKASAAELQAARAECEGLREELRAAASNAILEVERALLAQHSDLWRTTISNKSAPNAEAGTC